MHHHTRRGGRTGDVAEKLIQFGSYNIRNGINGGLKSSLWGMVQDNLELGVFQ